MNKKKLQNNEMKKSPYICKCMNSSNAKRITYINILAFNPSASNEMLGGNICFEAHHNQ